MPQTPKLTRAEAREQAREKAREQRIKDQRKAKTRKVLIQSTVSVIALGAIAGIVLAVTTALAPEGPGPRNMASSGVKIGSNFEVVATEALAADAEPVFSAANPSEVAEIAIFVDYTCPACAEFEDGYADTIRELISSGQATVEYFPVAFRDPSLNGTRYSTRSGNAAVCVADLAPEAFLDYTEALFRNQPQSETNPSLADSDLIQLAKFSGVENSDEVADCIKEERFAGWLAAATDRAMLNGPLPVRNAEITTIPGTPTVLVNGKQYLGFTPEELVALVNEENSK